MMPAPKNTHQPDEFERFDEAQPFLKLLAEMLNRLVTEQTEPEHEVAEVAAEVAEETAG
jgi:hypothetical protein